MEEKYFIGSNSDEPEKIFFNSLDAFVSGFNYIDSFDETGERIRAYKFVNEEYTTEF